MKKIIQILFFLTLTAPLLSYADTGIYGNANPDVIACHTIDSTIEYLYLQQTLTASGVTALLYKDNSGSGNGQDFNASTGAWLGDGYTGYYTDCEGPSSTDPGPSLADIVADGRGFYFVQVVGGSGTTTYATTTGSYATTSQNVLMVDIPNLDFFLGIAMAYAVAMLIVAFFRRR